LKGDKTKAVWERGFEGWVLGGTRMTIEVWNKIARGIIKMENRH
jgi:hypothetical protein